MASEGSTGAPPREAIGHPRGDRSGRSVFRPIGAISPCGCNPGPTAARARQAVSSRPSRRHHPPAHASGLGGADSLRFRPYLRWNRSTRPSLSISFCRPVKSGWHLEQISTLSIGTVERVWIASPQAQVMMAGMYCGWIPVFIQSPPFWEIPGNNSGLVYPNSDRFHNKKSRSTVERPVRRRLRGSRLLVHGAQEVLVALGLPDLLV